MRFAYPVSELTAQPVLAEAECSTGTNDLSSRISTWERNSVVEEGTLRTPGDVRAPPFSNIFDRLARGHPAQPSSQPLPFAVDELEQLLRVSQTEEGEYDSTAHDLLGKGTSIHRLWLLLHIDTVYER